MKKETQNTLVYDFIGTAFCLVTAFVLILMFSGCSNEESDPSSISLGGSTEETRIYALSGRMGDMQPNLLGTACTQDSLPGGGNFVYVEKGSVVTVYELDSLTLDTTGRFFADTIDNDSGRFAFEEMGLKSPYVLIIQDSGHIITRERGIARERITTYSAIINTQNITNVNVNALTSAKVPFLREYVAQGKSFAEANRMAEREVLKQLGIYEDLGPFEEFFDETSELAYAEALSMRKRDIIPYDLHSYISDFLYIPEAFVVDSGAEVAACYRNEQKMAEYQVGFLAEEGGIGQCTESRENEMAHIDMTHGDSVVIVCHSGKWTIGIKNIEYTTGSMTDGRDGQTYKTVTYNIGGVSQTWMAQNLNFADTASSGIDSALKANLKGNTYTQYYDPSGKNYGRFYTWLSAMNIGEHDIRMYSIDTVGDTIFLDQQCYDTSLDDCAYNDDECLIEHERMRERCDSLYASPCAPKDREGENLCVEREMETCGSDLECIGEVKLRCDTMYRGWCPENPSNWSLGVTEYMSDKNKDDYQGVCPEGWRLPTLNDWNSLLQMMGEQYGVDSKKTALALFGEEATGFGIERIVQMLSIDMAYRSISVSADYLAQFVVADAQVPWITLDGHPLGNHFDNVWYDYGENLGYGVIGNPSRAAAVRCIKN